MASLAAPRSFLHLALASALTLALAGCGDSSATTTSSTSGTGGGGTGGGGTGGGGGEAPQSFEVKAFDDVRITSNGDGPNFQQANTEIDWGMGPFADVKLVIDLASTCYPFDKWQDDPPPQGQNWPPLCDAFDRNFEFSLDDAEKEGDKPGFEVLRAITPFGGPLHVEVDLTDIANGLPGKHRMKVVIPTWSDGAGKVSGSNGGWNVTAKLVVTPGAAPRKVLAVVPLFNGGQGSGEPAAPAAPITFQVPAGTTSSRLEYRVTGHGGGAVEKGCIGPAEEFCKREHTILVDGAELEKFTPWRTDCKELCTLTTYENGANSFDYCLENPCGAVQSVKAPRANWCPGSVTPPYTWDAPALKTSGEHSFAWSISRVADGGSWRLSAHYIAFGD